MKKLLIAAAAMTAVAGVAQARQIQRVKQAVVNNMHINLGIAQARR